MFYTASVFYEPYSVRMQENTDQKNSKHGHFLRSVTCSKNLVNKT